MNISIVVAMTEDRCIGVNNTLPWNLPADLKHFKNLTVGKPIIMGRRTFESIGRVLPGRANIVVTRNPNWNFPGVIVKRSFEDAVDAAQFIANQNGGDEIMIVGGAQIYEEAMSVANRMYITTIYNTYEGDTFFPQIDLQEWYKASSTLHIDEAQCIKYSFDLILRKPLNQK